MAKRYPSILVRLAAALMIPDHDDRDWAVAAIEHEPCSDAVYVQMQNMIDSAYYCGDDGYGRRGFAPGE